MNINKFFKLEMIFVFLFMCCVMILPTDAFAAPAAPADTENTTIELSAEELAYREKSSEIIIGCPVQNCPLLFQNEKTGQIEGVTIDILNMISETTGLIFRYKAAAFRKYYI